MEKHLAVLIFTASFLTAFGHPENLTESGNPIVNSTTGFSEGQIIFINPGSLQHNGVVLGFKAFFLNQAMVHFQLWRKINTTVMELLGDLPYSPTSSMSVQQVFFSEQSLNESCVRLRPDDLIGAYFVGSPGAIAYSFQPVTPETYIKNMTGVAPARIGDLLWFDSLVFPYKFSMCALVDLNVDEYTAVEGSENLVYCTPSTELDMTSTPPVTLTPSAAARCTGTIHIMLLIIVITVF